MRFCTDPTTIRPSRVNKTIPRRLFPGGRGRLSTHPAVNSPTQTPAMEEVNHRMAYGDFWVALDVEYFEDPRMVAAGLKAEAFYVRSLAYMQRRMTDGFISHEAVRHLGFYRPGHYVKKLVEVGLWKEVPDGYVMLDFAHHNRSRADREQAKASATRRKRAHRARRKLQPAEDQTSSEQGEYADSPNGVTRDMPVTSRVSHGGRHADVTRPQNRTMKTSSSSARTRAGAYARGDDDDDETADAETPPPTPPTDPADGFPLQPTPDTPLTDLAWLWHCERHPEATLAFATRDDYVLAVLDLATDRFPPGRARAEWQGRILTEYLAELLGMSLTDSHRRRITALAASADHAIVLDGLSLAATRATGGVDQAIGYADRCIRERSA